MAPIGATRSAAATATAMTTAARASFIGCSPRRVPGAAPVLLDLSWWRRVPGTEHTAVGQSNPNQRRIWPAVFQRIADDGDLVAALDRGAGPPGARHHVGTSAFESPVGLLPFRVGDQDLDPGVRIVPLHFPDDSGQRHLLGPIECRKRVMRG